MRHKRNPLIQQDPEIRHTSQCSLNHRCLHRPGTDCVDAHVELRMCLCANSAESPREPNFEAVYAVLCVSSM
jgi:hypothetical protein